MIFGQITDKVTDHQLRQFHRLFQFDRTCYQRQEASADVDVNNVTIHPPRLQLRHSNASISVGPQSDLSSDALTAVGTRDLHGDRNFTHPRPVPHSSFSSIPTHTYTIEYNYVMYMLYGSDGSLMKYMQYSRHGVVAVCQSINQSISEFVNDTVVYQ